MSAPHSSNNDIAVTPVFSAGTHTHVNKWRFLDDVLIIVKCVQVDQRGTSSGISFFTEQLIVCYKVMSISPLRYAVDIDNLESNSKIGFTWLHSGFRIVPGRAAFKNGSFGYDPIFKINFHLGDDITRPVHFCRILDSGFWHR